MRKFNLLALTIVMVVLLTALVISQTSVASAAPEVQRVGLVIAYSPGDSITIVDRGGNQFIFELSPQLKIVPAHRANALAPGVYVTIIAPSNVPNGKHIATGIVIHPQPPSSFPIPTFTSTPLPTETPLPIETETSVPTETAAPTETSVVTETPTSTEVVTETPTETATETLTGSETPTETATPTATLTAESPSPTVETQTSALPSSGDLRSAFAAFVDWLASMLRQFLSN